MDEGFESGPFGTAFHGVMEKLYDPYRNEIISPDIIGRLLGEKEKLDSLIRSQLDEAFRYNGLPISGKRLVTFEMLRKIVVATLEYDRNYAPFIYLDGERKIYADLDVDGVKVNLMGIIDRLDSKEGTVRIVDYKTGSVKLQNKSDKDKVTVEKIFDTGMGNNRPYSAFQMYLYAYLMARFKSGTLNGGGLGSDPVEDMDICVYQMKEIFKPSLWTFGSNDAMLRDFEDRLKALIREIMSEGEFVARPSEKSCDYCPVRVLCSF